jgi:8-oxo-dGTP pyrophosphatase MutT (NUDIX family)
VNSCPGFREYEVDCPQEFWTHRASFSHTDRSPVYRCDLHGNPVDERSVVSLTYREHKILAISRGSDLFDWGLPGGKVEITDKSDWHAVTRETYEETGFLLYDPLPVFHKKCGKFTCTAFIGHLPFQIDPNFSRVTREGTVMLRDPADLVTDSCSFKDYNESLFRLMGIR